MRLTLVNADLPSATAAPPLGLASLAHAATCAGHDVEVRDYQLAPTEDSRNPNTFAAFCDTSDDVLGVSTSCMALPLVLAALRRLKTQHSELITVLGGIGAAGVDELIIKRFPSIDFVCRGEGEDALRELLDRLETGADTRAPDGFVCRLEGKPRVNSRRQRIRDLDRIEVNAWDYLDLSRYSLINVSTARGCPFPCTFCDVAPLLATALHHPVDRGSGCRDSIDPGEDSGYHSLRLRGRYPYDSPVASGNTLPRSKSVAVRC